MEGENLTIETETSTVERPPPWLVTFADVTALLLAFFVMLFAMSNLQSEKWETIISRISTSERTLEDLVPIPQSDRNVATVRLETALPLEYLANVLEEKLAADDVLNRAMVHRLDDLLVLSLPADVLFPPGEAELTPAARKALFRLGDVISTIGNRIDVRGHADPDPLSDSEFESKWAISLARAIAVANEFKRTGYERKITVLGLGDSRFAHLSPRLPETKRYELARRVDVVIHPTSGEL